MITEAKGVDITIDRAKCRFSMYDPTGCKKCLELCPQAVFSAVPVEEKRDFSLPKDKQWEPQQWMIVTTWEPLCTGCGVCLRACPYECLHIKINGNPI